MGKFINRYNNYNCIKRNDTEDIIKLSHYTALFHYMPVCGD